MKYKSNMSRVVDDLIKDIKGVSPSVISRVASEQLLGDIVRRIHNDGKDSSNNVIGPGGYSTDPIYVSIEGFIRQTNGKGKKLTPRGKYSDKDFKNGNKRKSRYFDLGYKEFKQEQTGVTQVNLVLSGQLQNDLAIAEFDKNTWGLSFSEYGLDIYKGLEDHYKVVIWYPTKEEKERMAIAIEDFIDKKINKK